MKTKKAMKIKTTIRTTIFILTVVLFFGLCFNLLIKSDPAYADSEWFDYSWSYRNTVNITGSTSSLTDYQVKVTVDFASGKMKSDFSDIRFVLSDNITLLSHWRASYVPSSTAEFWVKVPSIPSSGTTVYMYYGNSTANSVSNGEATFVFFDEFEPSSSKWAGSGFEHSTTGTGYVRAYKTAPGNVSSDLISDVIGSGDFKAHLKIKSEGYKQHWRCDYKHELKLIKDGGESGLDSSAHSDFTDKSYTISGNNLKLKLYAYAKGCENTVTRCTGWEPGAPFEYCYCHGNNCDAGVIAPICPVGYNEINYYCDELSWHDPCCIGGCGAGHDCDGGDCKECRVCKNPSLSAEAKLWIDDLYVRKYASPEPVASFGIDTEEEMLCALESGDCSSMPCCSPLSCVDYTCRSCLSLNCSADDAEDNSISEMGDAIDDVYCTWNIHDGCLVKEGVATVDGCNGIPSYWEPESCGGDGGTSDLWGEKKIYIDDINDYNIKVRCGVDDSSTVWINSSNANIPFVCCAYGDWADVTNKFITGWNTIKFKAVDACGDDAWGSCGGRWFDLNWEIIPRAPALNGNASSSSTINLSWSDRGADTYHLWSFDKDDWIYHGPDTGLIDRGGNHNNGIIHNDAVWTTGKIGNALQFDGVDDYVDCGNDASLNITDEITVEAWVKRDSSGADNQKMIIRKENAFFLDVSRSWADEAHFYLRVGGDWHAVADWGGDPVGTEWTHLLATYSSSTKQLKMYINGALKKTKTLSELASYEIETSGSNLKVNQDGDFDGKIDEVRIYNRALSGTEVAEHYNHTFSNDTGLELHLPFEEGAGTSTEDLSGSGLNANTTYSYKVMATKNGYDSDWSNSISATTWNQLPVADAGLDRFVVIGNSVNLDGSGSHDEGDTISYRWDYTPSNLISRWHFDENLGNVVYDTSGANNNDGTLKPASPIWTTGKVGNALSFDGVDDYIEISDSNSLDIQDNISIEAWARVESVAPPALWPYYKPINVTGSSSDLSDYQMLLTIDTAELISQGKMKADCSDIRIKDSDKTTQIPFWLESGCNTASTQIWVKIPSIPSTGTAIYMYYGNSSATSVSSGTNTFEFFDDFSGDLSKWDLSDKEAGSVVEIVSETLHILGYANQRAKVYTDNIGCSDNFMMTMKARPKAAAASGIYSFPSLTDGTNTLAHADWKSWNGNELRVFNGGTPSAYDMPKDSWYDIKITADQTNKTFDYYVNDVLKSNDFNTYSGSYSGTLNTIYFSAGASGNGGEAYIDNVIVCKYASPEPSAGAPGSEQIESSNQIILQKQGAYSLQTNGDGTQVYGFLNGNRLTASVPVPQLDEWHHYVLTYNRDKQILYINGEESAQTNFSEAINTNTDNLIIGEIFSGSIDEVRIYNKALSEDEIENLYEFGMGTLISDPFSSTPAFTPDTIGVYHIDLTVTDSYGGFSTDTVSITVASPTVCGDNNIQCPNTSGLCEICDGTDDALCPGECIAPGETRECLCPQPMPAWKEVKPKKE